MDSDSDDSRIFQVDHSNETDLGKRLDNMFDREKEILIDGQKRKVVYGTLEQQPRTVYEIVQPYLWKMASVTTEAATQAGLGIYNALSMGANWVYDKFINQVVPYTRQEIPKLFLVLTKGPQKNIENSDAFEVLEIDDEDYDRIGKREQKKKRVIIPLDPKEDPEFVKFLERQNFVIENSFPIDLDSSIEGDALIVPSGKFSVYHEEAIKKSI